MWYRMEGYFGSGKIWWIYSMNTLVKENLGNLWNSLSEWKIYSVKHRKYLHWVLNLRRQQSDGIDVHVLLSTLVRGYNKYKSLCTNPVNGEELICKRKVGNPCDSQAVVVKKEISHMLQVVCSVTIVGAWLNYFKINIGIFQIIAQITKSLHETFFNWWKFGGINLANSWSFTKFANVSHRQSYPPYSIVLALECYKRWYQWVYFIKWWVNEIVLYGLISVRASC